MKGPELLQITHGPVRQGAAGERVEESYCFSAVPLEFVDLIPPACQDKNFLYHHSRARHSPALNVKVTEFPSLLLQSGSPAWSITQSKRRPDSLRFALLGFTKGTGKAWANCHACPCLSLTRRVWGRGVGGAGTATRHSLGLFRLLYRKYEGLRS